MNRKVICVPPEELYEIVDSEFDLHQSAVESIEAARLRRALAALPPLERKVLELRWGLSCGSQLSKRQVGERLSLPCSRVWRIEQRAMGRLRVEYGVEASTTLPEAA